MKSKHRIVSIILTTLVLFTLVGCSFNEVRFNMDENRYREATLEVLLDALQYKDLEAIKGLFSKAAIEEVGDEKIEEGINYLFSVFEGSVISYDLSHLGDSEEIINGKRHKSTYIYADIETNVSRYHIRCLDHISNAIDRDNVGISNIIVLEQNDWLKYGLLDDSYVGVFRQDYYAEYVDSSLSGEEILEKITTSLENEDMVAIQGLFSTKTIKDVGEKFIAEDIEHLFALFNGSVVTHKLNSGNRVMNVVDGGLFINFRNSYIVTTEEDEYYIFFSGYAVNQGAPYEAGLEQLIVLRKADWLETNEYDTYDPKFRGVLRVD